MGIPDHLTCLLRNLSADQEATIRTRHGIVYCFQVGKGVWQDYILSPCLFNFYAEYIIWIARLNESKPGIKIAGRNINNLRYADDTTIMEESEEELNASWWEWKWRVKSWLKLSFKKWKSWHPVPSLHSTQMKKKQKHWHILVSWAPKSLQMMTAAIKLKDTCSLEEKLSST